MKDLIGNDFIKFWFEEGILLSEFQKDTELNLEGIKQVIELREEISEGQKQYWLYDIRNLKTLNKEVRDYADTYGQDYLNCIAVLINSHVTKFIFNSYLKLNKPKFPMRVFNSKEEAIKWLKDIKTQNEINNF